MMARRNSSDSARWGWLMNKLHLPLQMLALCLAVVLIVLINLSAFWSGNQVLFYLVVSTAGGFLGFISLSIFGSRDALAGQVGRFLWNGTLRTSDRSLLSVGVLLILMSASAWLVVEARSGWLTILLSFPDSTSVQESVTVSVRTSERNLPQLQMDTDRTRIKLNSTEFEEPITLRAESEHFRTPDDFELTGGHVAKLQMVPRANPADLVTAIENERQAVPLAGANPEYQGVPVYCEVVRFRFKASHNLGSKAPITIKSLTVESKPVSVTDQTVAQLGYRIDVNEIPTYGIVDIDTYSIALAIDGVSARYVIDKDSAVPVDSLNFLIRNGDAKSFEVRADGSDSLYLAEMVLETGPPGLFKARVRIDYDVAGESRSGETAWLYVFSY